MSQPVKLSQKLSFAVGALPDVIMNNSVKVLISPIYNVVLGVSPALIGIVQAMPRLFEAFVDPMIGNISDNHKSRWGRRRPFIALGAFLCAILFPVLWWAPRGMTSHFYFIYITVTSTIFYVAYSVYGVPWNAIGYELSDDYNERSRIMGFRAFFLTIGSFCNPWLFALVELAIFRDPIQGVRVVSVGMGIIFFAFGIIPAICCREGEQKQAAHQRKIALSEAWIDSFKNRPFVLLVSASVLVLIGILTIANLGFYLTLYYIEPGNMKKASVLFGLAGNASQLAGIPLIPIMTWMATHLGKRTTLSIAIVLGLIGTSLKWVCYTPVHPYWQLIPGILMAPGVGGVWMLTNSMMADVCDFEEMRSGLRREGVIGALYNWASKVGGALAFSISGIVLVCIGFDQKFGAAQPASTIFWMRFWFAAVPAIAYLLALILLAFYRLDESTVGRIHRVLERQHRLAGQPVDEPGLGTSPAAG